MKLTRLMASGAAMSVVALMTGCTIKNYEYKNYYCMMPGDDAECVASVAKMRTVPTAALPKAVVYETTCDCDDLVPVTLSSDGKSIVWYPGIHDVSGMSKPINLGKGYWLDRQGVTTTTVFTEYTYEEYSSLAKQPTAEQLFKAIKPGCRVKSIRVLDMTPSQAQNDVNAVKKSLGL